MKIVAFCALRHVIISGDASFQLVTKCCECLAHLDFHTINISSSTVDFHFSLLRIPFSLFHVAATADVNVNRDFVNMA